MIFRLLAPLSALFPVLVPASLLAQLPAQTISGWQMQDSAKVAAATPIISTAAFQPQGWYAAAVPGTVLTTLVNNGVYPEPLYGENMRAIPESLNKTSYWYRTTFTVPSAYKDRHTWLHFGGINYATEIWVNGSEAGTMRGAFIRGDFDISELVKPGRRAVLAVLVSPQPHPGVPHEHTVALGVGQNGGETAIDGPTFLSTIGWDWLPAVRDRDTGIWLPVTMDSTGPVVVRDPFITADLSAAYNSADLHVSTTLENKSPKPVTGTLTGVIQLQNSKEHEITFHQSVTVAANGGSARLGQQIHTGAAPFRSEAVVAERLRSAEPVHAHAALRCGSKIKIVGSRDAAVWHPQDRVPGRRLREPYAFGQRSPRDGARRQLGPR